MNAVHLLENKMSTVQKYLLSLSAFRSYTKEEILTDPIKRSALERQLYLLTQSTIDLAEAVVSHKKLRKPSTYKENFEILNEAGLITKKLTEKMSKMAGFRNIIAHEYITLDPEKLYEVLLSGPREIHKLLNELKTSLKI